MENTITHTLLIRHIFSWQICKNMIMYIITGKTFSFGVLKCGGKYWLMLHYIWVFLQNEGCDQERWIFRNGKRRSYTLRKKKGCKEMTCKREKWGYNQIILQKCKSDGELQKQCAGFSCVLFLTYTSWATASIHVSPLHKE